MLKERFDVIASSLGSYFGVGFNTPEEQLAFDLGLEENIFDEDSQDRMNLGIYLEDAVLNYFENKLSISITDRNDKIHWAFGDRLKCKFDGMAVYLGKPTVIECKVSNSQSKKFTDDKGYYLQVQAYMEASGCDQALLLGLYQGKPVYELIQKDEEVIGWIGELVEFLYACFNGISSPDEFPYDLIAKYNKKPILEEPELTKEDIQLLDELNKLKVGVKETETRIEEIEKYFKGTFSNIKYSGDDYSVTISTASRPGGVDLDMLKIEHQEIDFEKYMKPGSSYSVMKVTKKKAK